MNTPHLPLMPLFFNKKSLTLEKRMENLEVCLKNIKSKKSKELNEKINPKPNHETNDDSTAKLNTSVEPVKEKRKPGRPAGKKKLNS